MEDQRNLQEATLIQRGESQILWHMTIRSQVILKAGEKYQEVSGHSNYSIEYCNCYKKILSGLQNCKMHIVSPNKNVCINNSVFISISHSKYIVLIQDIPCKIKHVYCVC